MKAFLKKEIVFVIALSAAIITAVFNLDPRSWASGIDYRTLALLFSLMGISEGLKKSGFFETIRKGMCKNAHSVKTLSLTLLLVVFISSMFFTNDVALLMFVPFTLMMLESMNLDESYALKLVVLETIAANLGSMTTPVGNPQNLYITSFFATSASSFFATIIPYSLLSAALVFTISYFQLKTDKEVILEDECASVLDRSRTVLYLIFLLIAILAVFNVIDWRVLFVAELISIILFDRSVLKRIDYILLLTFVSFFIFSVNMRCIEAVRNALVVPMGKMPVLTSAVVSQVISNVPAAILLSPFALDFKGVLIGTDIGGLGTPIASLASLISLKIYFKREKAEKGKYMKYFLLLNFALLVILLLFSFALKAF